MDVKSIFLYEKLEPGEDIFLRPPQGIQLKRIKLGEMLKLHVCIYGLKQVARRWYKTYMSILYRIGFKHSSFDKGIFYRIRTNDLSIIFIHIDNSSIITESPEKMTQLKNNIKSHLKCDDMGELSWMLGVAINLYLKHSRTSQLQRYQIGRNTSRFICTNDNHGTSY